jgi:hypothetical protein
MKSILTILIFCHGLVHFLGFAKAYELMLLKELTLPVTRGIGLLWLLVSMLFVTVAVLSWMGSKYWWMLAGLTLLMSQGLIFLAWRDARFGAIVNVIILLFVLVEFFNWRFEKNYINDVETGINKTVQLKQDFIQEMDLEHLPHLVRQYLKKMAVIGTPKLKSAKMILDGRMRGKDQKWFSFTAEQFNFFGDPERLFFMKANVKHLPMYAYHRYKNGEAVMTVKLFSIFNVVKVEGQEMFTAETVTYFNDLCMMTPAALIDKRIRWQTVDEKSVKAFFTNEGVTISAILYFDEEGNFVNFTSEDRMDINDHQKHTFSTPVISMQELSGKKVLSEAEARWRYDNEEFVYAKIHIRSIEFNPIEY